MEKIIYHSPKGKYLLDTSSLGNDYKVYKSTKLKSIIIHLIDQPDAALFVYDLKDDDKENFQVMSLVQDLNGIMPFIGVVSEDELISEEQFQNYNQNISLVTPETNIQEILHSKKENRRKFNRTTWPLSSEFYSINSPDRSESGEVLSLSIGGAFIKTTDFSMIGEENLLFEIKFKDFKFLVEGKIIRTNKEMTGDIPIGFAVEFINVSEATKKYIGHLINDRILSNLLLDLDGLEQTEENPETEKAVE